jgi:hypothetical protein
MFDTTDILLLAVHQVLNGNVSYNSTNVPFYDEKKKIRTVDTLYVLYSTQQEIPNPDQIQGVFETDSFLDMEICYKPGSEVSKSVLSNVANQILTLLFPTRESVSITAPSGFQIPVFEYGGSMTRAFEISPTESILRKFIKVKAKIIQQS